MKSPDADVGYSVVLFLSELLSLTMASAVCQWLPQCKQTAHLTG